MAEYIDISKEELLAKLEEKENEIESLKEKINKKEKTITLKVSEKGAVQIMGLRRFPITLYAKECFAIFNIEGMIKEFIQQNNLK